MRGGIPTTAVPIDRRLRLGQVLRRVPTPSYEKAAAGGTQRRLTNDPPEGLDQRDP